MIKNKKPLYVTPMYIGLKYILVHVYIRVYEVQSWNHQ